MRRRRTARLRMGRRRMKRSSHGEKKGQVGKQGGRGGARPPFLARVAIAY